MRQLILIPILFITFISLAQKKEVKTPRKVRKSIPLLAKYLTEKKETETEKVEAIYTWVTENINYDYDLLQSEKYFTGIEPKTILKSKKAICNGYVELMKSILDEVGVKNETVTGYIHNLNWRPGKIAMKEEHAWIAVYMDEKWTLADPTWDAGYIGRIPKKIKSYEVKTYKKTTFKKKEKQEKVLAKRKIKEVERKKRYDDKPLYANKIGFIKFPQKKYFGIHTDTFLLTHLPIMPMWQLRDNMVTIHDFAKSEDSLKVVLEEAKSRRTNFEEKIEDFMELNFLDQQIVCGDEGTSYNQLNPMIKGLYYYNYMALINNKDIKKLARGSEFEITPEKYDELNAKNDTILKYIKLYKGVEKHLYKEDKDFDKNSNSLTVDKDKINTKLVGTIVKLEEKLHQTLEKDNDKIDGNLDKIDLLYQKIAEEFPGAINYIEPKNLDKKFIASWNDSIKIELDILNKMSNYLDSIRVNSKFNVLLSNVDFMNYLLKENSNYIPFNSYSTNEVINKIDSLLIQEGNSTIVLFKDSIPLELLPKDAMDGLKKIESFTKAAKSELKLLSKENSEIDLENSNVFLQSKLIEAAAITQHINTRSRDFNENIEGTFKSYAKDFTILAELMESQKNLKLEKYTYIKTEAEKGHKRDVSLIKKIDGDTKKWKKQYSVKN